MRLVRVKRISISGLHRGKPHMCNIRTYLRGTFFFLYEKFYSHIVYLLLSSCCIKKEEIGGVVCHCNYKCKAGAFNQSHCGTGRVCCLSQVKVMKTNQPFTLWFLVAILELACDFPFPFLCIFYSQKNDNFTH